MIKSFDAPDRIQFPKIRPPVPMPVASAIPLDSHQEDSKKVCLFYCAEMEALALRVAAESDASITWR